MIIDEAFKKLNLDKKNDMHDIKKLKKHYHFLALQYHPDKNKAVDSKKEFQEINEAYQVLINFYSINNNTNNNNTNNNNTDNNNTNNINSDNINSNVLSFEELFQDFIGLLNIKNKEEIDIIKKYFKQKYNYYNSLLLNKLSENNYFKKLFNIFNKVDDNYKNILIINTELENVLNNEIYKLELDNETLYIPLWYKEVIHNDYLIKIKIININSENNCNFNNKISIDNDNNIFISLERNLNDIIDKNLIFNIRNREFVIENKLLYLKSICNYKLNNCGLINPYCDVSEISQTHEYKSHIFVCLKLK